MMTLNEAKEVFINKAFIPTDDGSGTIYDPDKWREACHVISKWLEKQPCEDAISREYTLTALRSDPSFICTGDQLNAIRIIEGMPLVNPQPKTGHWIESKDERGCIKLTCSCCGYGSAINSGGNFL